MDRLERFKLYFNTKNIIGKKRLTALCLGLFLGKASPDATPDVSVMFNPATKTIQGQEINKESNSDQSSGNPSEETIYLNFENVSLSSILDHLAKQKNINYAPHKDLAEQRVSLSTRKPISLERAWKILLTLLEVNGFSLLEVDGLYRVVSSKDNGIEPLPYYSSQTTEPVDLPDSDLVVRYMYFFKNIKSDIADDILRSLLSADNSTQQLRDLQAILIKDKCHNIKAALKIIQELDTGGLRQSIRIVPLKEADADTVQRLLSQDIIGSDDNSSPQMKFRSADGHGESSYFSTATKIISDPSKNSLIILGTPTSIDRICNFIYKYIDIPIGSADSRIHIKNLRYAKAETLRPILENIIKPPAGQGSDKRSIVGQFKFFEDVIIREDAGNPDDNTGCGNRLIVSANKEDWSRLDHFIDMLDKPIPQVAFEVMVIYIDLEVNKQLGAQLQSEGMVGMGINRALFNNAASLSGVSTEDYNTNTDKQTLPAYKFTDIVAQNQTNSGFTYATLGTPGINDANKVWALIQATATNTNAHVVTQPFLVTNNYQECSLVVGQSQRLDGGLISEKGEQSIQQKVEKSANTEIHLTPQINYDGIVNLKINLTIDSFGLEVAGDNISGPPINRQAINTRVSMAAGEVLVLGGMTKGNDSLSKYETPLLSKIPILGNLFKSTTQSHEDSNLYVFIRPSIIKPNFDGAPDEYTQLKLDYSKYQMMKNDTYAQEYDPIQRWYFKPSGYSVKQKLADATTGIFRPIDDFTYGKQQPKSVDLKADHYFTPSAEIQKNKQKKSINKLKSRQKDKKI